MTRDTACSPVQHLPRDRARARRAPPAAPSPRAPPPGRRCPPRCRRSSRRCARCSAPSSSRITGARRRLVARARRARCGGRTPPAAPPETRADRWGTARAAPVRRVPSDPSCCPCPDSTGSADAVRRQRRRDRRHPADRRAAPQPERSRFGSVSPPTARATLPSVSLPGIAVRRGVGRRPDPRPSSTMIAARRALLTVPPRCSGARPGPRAR